MKPPCRTILATFIVMSFSSGLSTLSGVQAASKNVVVVVADDHSPNMGCDGGKRMPRA